MFSACKYEDGPWISFRSEANRLNNEWQVQMFKIYTNDTTIGWKTYYDWKYTFNLPEGNAKDEGTMYLYAPKPFCNAIDSGGYHGKGYWKFENGYNDLTMKYWFIDPLDSTQTVGDSCGIWPLVTQEEVTLEVRRLKHDELWLRYTFGGDSIVSIRFEES
ncbi:MAG: hypothetical protein C0592_03895 [Marinilabiliales bacterium]|nr:MAG: hypothetical protein C0592_03895 [Marinilabiliales bacterium]